MTSLWSTRPPRGPGPKTSGMAIAALVTGLLGCLSVAGLVLGILALVRIRHTGERGRGLAIGGIVAFAVWSVIFATGLATGAVSVWGRGVEGDRESGGSAGSASHSALKVGQCFGFQGDRKSANVALAQCETPHDGEVVAIFSLPDGPWPGQDEVIQDGEAACQARVTARFKTSQPIENGRAFGFYPNKLGWRLGDRVVHCSIVAAQGTRLAAPLASGDQSTRRWNELKTGDCFTDPQDAATQTVALRECTQPHNAQILHAFQAPPGPYPGDEAFKEQAVAECRRAKTRLRNPPPPVPVALGMVRADEREWASGSRTVVCYVHTTQGTLTRSLLKS